MATGWVYHELYMWHDTGRAAPPGAQRRWLQAWEHYENPETKRRFRNLVEVAGLFDDLVALKPRMATVDEILRFHTPDIRRVDPRDERGGGRRRRRGHAIRPRLLRESRCSRRAGPSPRSTPSSTGGSTTPTRSSARRATTPRPTAAAASASSATS